MVRQEGVIKDNTMAMQAVVGSLDHMRRAMDDISDQVRANARAVIAALDRLS